jgi:AraC-like DNA-binding protein
VGASCGLSQSRLYGLFPDEGGIANYIWARRLERAAKDLHDPAFEHLSVGQIAEAVGFTRHSHFSTAFRRRFGLTAKDWRNGLSSAELSANKLGSFFLVDLLRQFSSPMRPYPMRKSQTGLLESYLK